MIKSDVLCGMTEIQAAINYEINGIITDEVPSNLSITGLQPVYKKYAGWPNELPHDQGFDALDDNFKNYVKDIEQWKGWMDGMQQESVKIYSPTNEENLPRA